MSSWWDHVLDTGLSSRHYVLNRVTKQNVPREDQQSKQGDVTKETAWITGDDYNEEEIKVNERSVIWMQL